MGAGLVAALLDLGCQAPGPGASPAAKGSQKQALTAKQIEKLPIEESIVRVAAYYAPYNPWIWTDDRSRVMGIVVSALYLQGPKVLGVFGDGVIRPRLYVLEPAKERGAAPTPRLVKEWSFDVQQAMPFRAKKQTAMGLGYRLHLLWSDELNLAGKEVRMTVIFERTDGTIVHSGKKDFRVPKASS